MQREYRGARPGRRLGGDVRHVRARSRPALHRLRLDARRRGGDPRRASRRSLLTVPALLQLRGRWGLLRRSLLPVLAYGLVAVAGCQLFFFNAVEHLSVGVALLLEYSGTLLVVLWLWLRHGQRPRRLTVFGGVLSIGGLALVLDLTGEQHVDLVGVLWGLAAAHRAGHVLHAVLAQRRVAAADRHGVEPA